MSCWVGVRVCGYGLKADRRQRNQQEPADPGECHQGVGGWLGKHFVISFCVFFLYLTVWGVEPLETHQKSWLEGTGVCKPHPSLLAVHNTSIDMLSWDEGL